MTTYPLATLAAEITSTGVSAPSYQDVNLSLVASLEQIHGSDIVLDDDTQDGQLVGIVSLAITDANQGIVDAYNSFSPAKALGAALSSNVKINGLQRLIPSNSSTPVDVVGQAGTTIIDGIIESEVDGSKWDLPSSVVIPVGGLISVTATAQEEGDITATAGTLTKIVTTTRGWQTVTNPSDATVGAPVEDDATLRNRQSVSTELPAETILEAITGRIANLDGVQSVKPYENDTDVTDANGLPPHSIAMVVEGGEAVEIATVIADTKAPGTGTYGTTTRVIIDENGVPNTINFFVPTQVTVEVEIDITALTGYVSTTGDSLVADTAEYISGLGVGGSGGFVYNSKLYTPANDGELGTTYNVTGIRARRDSDPFATTDVVIAFNEIPVTLDTDITLTVT